MRFTNYAVVIGSLLAGVQAGLEDVKSTTKLTAANFDSAINGKNALVAFFAPWCGHCKSLEPTWEALGKDFADEDSVLIGQLDADNADNRPTAERFGVKGYPTIKFFPADGSAPLDYQSGRTESAFLEYINEQAGTHRSTGGLLNDIAGRLPDFDALLASYLGSTDDARTTILSQAKQLAAKLQVPAQVSAATYYLKVFEKAASSSDWAQKEFQRLQKLASKRGTMAGKQLDDLQIRQNILAAFNGASASAASIISQAGASASSVSSVVSSAAETAAAQASSSAASVAGEADKAAKQAYASGASVAADASKTVESAASVVSASASSVYSAASTGAQKIVGEL